jgi:uncharacterized membrane protein YfcA
MLIGFLFLLSILAFSISAVAGGSAGLMLMPVLAMLLPGAQVAAALSVGTVLAGSALNLCGILEDDPMGCGAVVSSGGLACGGAGGLGADQVRAGLYQAGIGRVSDGKPAAAFPAFTRCPRSG